MVRWLPVILAAIAALLLPAPAGWADTLTYPGPLCASTLQACIDATTRGDVVEIATNAPIAGDLVLPHGLTLRPAPGFAPRLAGTRLSAGGGGTADHVFTIQGLVVESGFLDIVQDGAGTLTANVLDNVIAGGFSRTAVTVRVATLPGPFGAVSFTIRGNEITVPADAGPGPSGQSSAIAVRMADVPGATGLVADNRITMGANAQGAGISLVNTGPPLAADVIGNVITGVDYGEGIDVQQQGVGGTTTARIIGNVVTGQGTAGGGAGAIQVYASEGAIAVSILNNTIVGNRYGIAIGGRPDLGASLSGTVANNVIANNQLRAGLTIDEFRATVETRFNLFFGNGPELESPLPLGPGSIEADPRFVGPADLHLRPTSPAVNAGDTSLVPADVTTDAGGDPRTVLTVDLGAYELQAPVPALAVAAGPGGGPQVSAFDRSGVPLPAPLGAFFPFPVGFTGGAFVALGDVNGDEVPDLVTAAGPGGGPHVRVFDGATGSELMSFFPYAPGFTGGVRVAAGDVDGDGRADVVTAPGPGGGPDVRVFSGATGSLLTSFFAYAPAFTAGVYVAAGDVNGDGQADIVTGAGAGGGPHVQAFSGAGGGLLLSFFAYDPGFTGGVHVAAGDVTGDGRSDVVTGTGAGGGPHVRVFDGATGAEVSSLFAYDPGFIGGVFVGAHDFSGDGRADLVTGTGPGGGPHVKVFDGATGGERGSFFPFPPGFLGGVAVAGAP